MSLHWEDGSTGSSSVTELGGWNQWLFWQQSYNRGCGSMGARLSPWPCFLVSLQCLQGGDQVTRAGMGGSEGRAESVVPEGEVVGGAGEQEHEGNAGNG